MRRLAVANGPNIFQMLLVIVMAHRSYQWTDFDDLYTSDDVFPRKGVPP